MDTTHITGRTFASELIFFAVIVLVFVVPIRLFVAQPFIVNGSSMEPTFASNEYLIIDEISYRFRDPKRGNVVVFHFPDDQKKYFIKRVIGLPNETVVISKGTVQIINDEHPDGFMIDEPYVDPINATSDEMRVTLGENNYFVMGDNRSASFDSRSWGPLDEELIVGRAFLRLFPIQGIGIFPGNYEYNENQRQ